MFRTFKKEEDISGQNLVKSSVQRNIRQKLLDEYSEDFASVVDEIIPKKAQLLLHKWYVCTGSRG